METSFQGQAIPATMVIAEDGGRLTGSWHSQGMEMELTDLEVKGSSIRFSRTMGAGGSAMQFEGTIEGDTIEGAFSFQGQKLECSGQRSG